MSQLMRWTIVAAFLVAYVFSFIDRMILSLMVEPLKRDLLLSDTQISLLHGLAFAVFYTLVGLPIGRVIDRVSRIKVAAVGIALWSATTAASGLAQSYAQLLLARIGVAVGESTLTPAAYSLFADLFDRRRLGFALGIYNLGSAIGAGIAMVLGGVIVQYASGQQAVSLPLIGEVRPWQMTFFYVGLPGLLVAAATAMLPETGRRTSAAGAGIAAIPVPEVLRFARSRSGALAGHHLGVAFSNLAAFAIVSWMPAMLVRTYQWSIAQAGLAVGIALLVGGLLGLTGGGWLADRQYSRARTVGRMRLCLYATLCGIPAAALLGLQSSPIAAVVLFGVAYMFSIMPISSASAALQEIVPPPLRGQMSAFYLFVVNIVGIGLGSTAVALLSDHVFTQADGIRFSLSVIAPLALLAAAACYASSLGPVARGTKAPAVT
jgi:MFS family permease